MEDNYYKRGGVEAVAKPSQQTELSENSSQAQRHNQPALKQRGSGQQSVHSTPLQVHQTKSALTKSDFGQGRIVEHSLAGFAQSPINVVPKIQDTPQISQNKIKTHFGFQSNDKGSEGQKFTTSQDISNVSYNQSSQMQNGNQRKQNSQTTFARVGNLTKLKNPTFSTDQLQLFQSQTPLSGVQNMKQEQNERRKNFQATHVPKTQSLTGVQTQNFQALQDPLESRAMVQEQQMRTPQVSSGNNLRSQGHQKRIMSSSKLLTNQQKISNSNNRISEKSQANAGGFQHSKSHANFATQNVHSRKFSQINPAHITRNEDYNYVPQSGSTPLGSKVGQIQRQNFARNNNNNQAASFDSPQFLNSGIPPVMIQENNTHFGHFDSRESIKEHIEDEQQPSTTSLDQEENSDKNRKKDAKSQIQKQNYIYEKDDGEQKRSSVSGERFSSHIPQLVLRDHQISGSVGPISATTPLSGNLVQQFNTPSNCYQAQRTPDYQNARNSLGAIIGGEHRTNTRDPSSGNLMTHGPDLQNQQEAAALLATNAQTSHHQQQQLSTHSYDQLTAPLHHTVHQNQRHQNPHLNQRSQTGERTSNNQRSLSNQNVNSTQQTQIRHPNLQIVHKQRQRLKNGQNNQRSQNSVVVGSFHGGNGVGNSATKTNGINLTTSGMGQILNPNQNQTTTNVGHLSASQFDISALLKQPLSAVTSNNLLADKNVNQGAAHQVSQLGPVFDFQDLCCSTTLPNANQQMIVNGTKNSIETNTRDVDFLRQRYYAETGVDTNDIVILSNFWYQNYNYGQNLGNLSATRHKYNQTVGSLPPGGCGLTGQNNNYNGPRSTNVTNMLVNSSKMMMLNSNQQLSSQNQQHMILQQNKQNITASNNQKTLLNFNSQSFDNNTLTTQQFIPVSQLEITSSGQPHPNLIFQQMQQSTTQGDEEATCEDQSAIEITQHKVVGGRRTQGKYSVGKNNIINRGSILVSVDDKKESEDQTQSQNDENDVSVSKSQNSQTQTDAVSFHRDVPVFRSNTNFVVGGGALQSQTGDIIIDGEEAKDALSFEEDEIGAAVNNEQSIEEEEKSLINALSFKRKIQPLGNGTVGVQQTDQATSVQKGINQSSGQFQSQSLAINQAKSGNQVNNFVGNSQQRRDWATNDKDSDKNLLPKSLTRPYSKDQCGFTIQLSPINRFANSPKSRHSIFYRPSNIEAFKQSKSVLQAGLVAGGARLREKGLHKSVRRGFLRGLISSQIKTIKLLGYDRSKEQATLQKAFSIFTQSSPLLWLNLVKNDQFRCVLRGRRVQERASMLEQADKSNNNLQSVAGGMSNEKSRKKSKGDRSAREHHRTGARGTSKSRKRLGSQRSRRTRGGGCKSTKSLYQDSSQSSNEQSEAQAEIDGLNQHQKQVGESNYYRDYSSSQPRLPFSARSGQSKTITTPMGAAASAGNPANLFKEKPIVPIYSALIDDTETTQDIQKLCKEIEAVEKNFNKKLHDEQNLFDRQMSKEVTQTERVLQDSKRGSEHREEHRKNEQRVGNRDVNSGKRPQSFGNIQANFNTQSLSSLNMVMQKRGSLHEFEESSQMNLQDDLKEQNGDVQRIQKVNRIQTSMGDTQGKMAQKESIKPFVGAGMEFKLNTERPSVQQLEVRVAGMKPKANKIPIATQKQQHIKNSSELQQFQSDQKQILPNNDEIKGLSTANPKSVDQQNGRFLKIKGSFNEQPPNPLMNTQKISQLSSQNQRTPLERGGRITSSVSQLKNSNNTNQNVASSTAMGQGTTTSASSQLSKRKLTFLRTKNINFHSVSKLPNKSGVPMSQMALTQTSGAPNLLKIKLVGSNGDNSQRSINRGGGGQRTNLITNVNPNACQSALATHKLTGLKLGQSADENSKLLTQNEELQDKSEKIDTSQNYQQNDSSLQQLKRFNFTRAGSGIESKTPKSQPPIKYASARIKLLRNDSDSTVKSKLAIVDRVQETAPKQHQSTNQSQKPVELMHSISTQQAKSRKQIVTKKQQFVDNEVQSENSSDLGGIPSWRRLVQMLVNEFYRKRGQSIKTIPHAAQVDTLISFWHQSLSRNRIINKLSVKKSKQSLIEKERYLLNFLQGTDLKSLLKLSKDSTTRKYGELAVIDQQLLITGLNRYLHSDLQS